MRDKKPGHFEFPPMPRITKTRAQFGRYEKGQDLRMSSLIKIVNAFNISLKEFFSEGFD